MLIYVAEDRPETRQQIQTVLGKAFGSRATVEAFATCNGVLGAMNEALPDVLVMDLCMEGGYREDYDRSLAAESKSFHVIRAAAKNGTKVIVMSNLEKEAALAEEYGIHAWLNKTRDLDANNGIGLIGCIEKLSGPRKGK